MLAVVYLESEAPMNRSSYSLTALSALFACNLLACDDLPPGCGPSPIDTSDGGQSPGTSDGGTPDAAIPAGGIGSCDLRPLGNPSTAYCQEYIADPAVVAVYKTSCTSSAGTWISGGCPHPGALGACGTTSTKSPIVTINTWYYLGGPYGSAQYLQAVCEGNKSTYSAP